MLLCSYYIMPQLRLHVQAGSVLRVRMTDGKGSEHHAAGEGDDTTAKLAAASVERAIWQEILPSWPVPGQAAGT